MMGFAGSIAETLAALFIAGVLYRWFRNRGHSEKRQPPDRRN
jgi:hypothetical protein